jgi:biotin carboxyl carrier protein
MKYYLRTQSGRRLEVEVLEDAGEEGFRLAVDGEDCDAVLRDVDRLGQYALVLDGRSYAVSIEESDEQNLLVNIAGESWEVVAEDEREKAAGAIAAQGPPKAEQVKAAMPGVIVAVHAAPGDEVAPGQPLAVLEAMKMQNEVASQHGGVVEEVLVAAGDRVDAGQALVKLAPPQRD